MNLTVRILNQNGYRFFLKVQKMVLFDDPAIRKLHPIHVQVDPGIFVDNSPRKSFRLHYLPLFEVPPLCRPCSVDLLLSASNFTAIHYQSRTGYKGGIVRG